MDDDKSCCKCRPLQKKYEFFNLTSIMGFGHINQSSSNFEKIFWYIIVLTFIGWTTFDIIKLIEDYKIGHTTTEMEINFNDTLSPRNLTFCLSMDIGDHDEPIVTPELTGLMLLGERLLLRRNLTLNDLASEIRIALREFENPDDFLNSTWMVYGYYRSESYSTSRLLLIPTVYYHFANHWSMATKQRKKYYNEFYETASNLILNYCSFYGISQRSLFQKLGRSIHDLLFINYQINEESNPDYLKYYTTAMGSMGDHSDICFRIEYTLSYMDTNPKRPQPFYIAVVFYVFNDFDINPFQLYLDLEGRRFTSDYGTGSQTLFKCKIGQDLYIRIRDLTEYEALSEKKGIQRCSMDKDDPYAKCLAECEDEAARRVLNCSNVKTELYEIEKDLLRMCSMEDYMSQRWHQKTENIGMCVKKCRHSCTEIGYKIDIEIEHTLLTLPSEYSFGITYDSLTYMKFSERRKYTWQNLLASVGGILCFWIGASFIGVIHLLIYLVKSFGAIFTQQKIKGKDSNVKANIPQKQEFWASYGSKGVEMTERKNRPTDVKITRF